MSEFSTKSPPFEDFVDFDDVLSVFSSSFLSRPVIDGSLAQELGPYVDADKISDLQGWELGRATKPLVQTMKLLDFGCGTGRHQSALERLGFEWWGADSRDTMVSSQTAILKENPRLALYDGGKLPFESGAFGGVISFQVLEHLRDLGGSLSEIRRVLCSEGVFAGTVSQMEPMHGYSTFNMTPFGLKTLCKQHGFDLLKVYPLVDIVTMISSKLAAGMGRPEMSRKLMKNRRPDSAFNTWLCKVARDHGVSFAETNLLLLMYSAQFAFIFKAR